MSELMDISGERPDFSQEQIEKIREINEKLEGTTYHRKIISYLLSKPENGTVIQIKRLDNGEQSFIQLVGDLDEDIDTLLICLG